MRSHNCGRGRIERVATGEWLAGQRAADDVEIAREYLVALGTIEPKGRKGGRISAGADAEFEPRMRHQIENGRVLRHPHRIFQRQRDDAGAEADARGLRGDEAEKGERSGKPALPLMEMVLRNPCGIEASFLRLPDLLGRQTIPFRRRRLIE